MHARALAMHARALAMHARALAMHARALHRVLHVSCTCPEKRKSTLEAARVPRTVLPHACESVIANILPSNVFLHATTLSVPTT